jgi:hypothetical protein
MCGVWGMDKVEILTIRDNQLNALQGSRDRISAIRTERIKQKEACSTVVASFNLVLQRLEDEKALFIRRRDKIGGAMRTIAETWLGHDVPELVRKEIQEKQEAVDILSDSIAKSESKIKQLVDARDQRQAQLELAEESVANAENDLKQVDIQIAAIRGF